MDLEPFFQEGLSPSLFSSTTSSIFFVLIYVAVTVMADSKESGAVPTWDGQARGWRRYTREVAWFVQSTPTHKRRYCASRLMGKLSGPARLLAMSWPQVTFDAEDGTKRLLQRLAASPLVRRTLPNAAAICQQYFAFRRQAQESIGNFLVRETLVHEEFVEAIIRLHEEKLGVTQESRDFGLPAVRPDRWTDDQWGEDEWWYYEEEYENAERDDGAPAHGDGDQVPDERADQAEDEQGPGAGGEARATIGATTGSSPSHRGDGPGEFVGSEGSPPGRVRSQGGGSGGMVAPQAIDEMSIADSFIMGVLRGWRLLQAAGLTPEEKRDILSSTRNSLDYEVIAQALQGLWDEQLLGHRYQHHATGGHSAYYMSNTEDMDGFFTDYQDEWWYDDGWDDAYAYYHDYHDDWWDDRGDGAYGFQATSERTDPEDEEKLREAQQAEKVAESLALEAQRTWADAQRATQALRKDRGFGAGGGASHGKCFNCGGDHFVRDCPDRRHPGKSGGKFRNYMMDSDDHEAYYVGKGKGKSKGKRKGKYGSWMEAQALWKGTGKMKTKNKEPHRTVNAYHAHAQPDFYINGLELTSTLEATAATSAKRSPEVGMLDCGATASAAPEAVVKDLIGVILSHDKQAHIELDQSSRPYFRFGDGRWGRALYRLHVTSDLSGVKRKFALYALPNPAEYFQTGFNKANLVPVLIGMDFLGKDGNGLIVDFTTGLSVSSFEEQPEVVHLVQNQKGHFMLDICKYLTGGHTRREGHAHVVVLPKTVTNTSKPEAHVLELHPVQFDLAISDQQFELQCLEKSKNQLLQLHQKSREQQGLSTTCSMSAAAASASMCGATAPAVFPTTSSPTSSRDGGTGPSGCAGGGDSNSTGDAQGQECGEAFGSISDHEGRSAGSPGRLEELALLRTPCSRSTRIEHARTVATLRPMRLQDELHPTAWIQRSVHSGQESRDGGSSPSRIEASHGGLCTNGDDCEGHASQDRCRGSAADPHQRPQGQLCGAPRAPESGRDVNQQCHQSVGQLADDDRNGNHNHQPGGRVRGPRPRPSAVNEKMAPKALTMCLGNRVMSMVTLMATAASGLLLDLHLEGRDGLWEIACAPHSWLSISAEQHDLRPRRINLSNGYDLYKAETWSELRELRRLRRPKKLWFSLPCTKWCPWTSINYSSEERREQLEAARRKERKMLWQVNKFILECLAEDEDIQVYFEWPTRCDGWRQRPMEDLRQRLEGEGVPWMNCRIDGCRYGLMNEEGTAFLHKRWTIKTTDEKFHQVYRAKVCPGNHEHCRIEGSDTSRTAYYPWKLVQSISRHWRDQLVPQRHLALLNRKDDLPALVPPDGDDAEELPAKERPLREAVGDADSEQEGEHELQGLLQETDKIILKTMFLEALRREDFSFEAFETLMEQFVDKWKSVPLHHGKWHWGTSGRSCTFGGYSHGGLSGVCKLTEECDFMVKYLNKFVKHHLPQHKWSSFVVNVNCKSTVHKDCHNLKNSTSAVIGVGCYDGGGLWIEGTPPGDRQQCRRQCKDGSYKKGYVEPTRHQFVCFNPHREHATEAWTGNRICLSFYTTRMTPWMSIDDRKKLSGLGFMLVSNMEALASQSTGDSPARSALPSQSTGDSPARSALPSQSTSDSHARSVLPSRPTTADDEDVVPEGVTTKEFRSWQAQVAKFHKAAGHPTNRNLARIVQDAGHASWKIEVARNFHCPSCASLRPGGTTSGQVPPASTHAQYAAWEAVVVDSSEWIPPGKKTKVKFLLFMDVATKLRVVHPLFICDFLEMRAESGDDLIRAFAEKWLGPFPRPRVMIMDSAKSFASENVSTFMARSLRGGKGAMGKWSH